MKTFARLVLALARRRASVPGGRGRCRAVRVSFLPVESRLTQQLKEKAASL